MNYFEESQRHFKTSSAKVYLEFCQKNSVEIARDIHSARRELDFIISDDILDNFEVCYLQKKEVYLGFNNPLNEVFLNFELSKCLTQRNDFCSQRVINALQLCYNKPEHVFLFLTRDKEADKIEYLIKNVSAPDVLEAFKVASEIAYFSADLYKKYIDWIKPSDMRGWHKEVLSDSYGKKQYIPAYIALLKDSELVEFTDMPLVAKELELRQIIAQQKELDDTIEDSNKSKVNKL